MSIRVWCNKIGLIPSVLCGLVLLAFYVAVTPLAQNNSSMGLAGYAWILALYVALCVEAGLCGYKLLSQAKEEGRWLTVWVTGLWLLAICASVLPAYLLGAENSFQISCALSQINKNYASGFNSACFIGYPTRAYFLQSLPANLFGMSHITANAGTVLILMPGLIIFSRGLRLILRGSAMSDTIAATVLGVFFQSTLLFWTIAYHDQTTQPFAITLSLVGLFASATLDKRRSALVLLLGWLILGTSYYPPTLAALLLAGCCLAWAARAGRLPAGGAILVAAGIVFAAVAFLETLPFREDLRLIVDSKVLAEPIQRLQRVFSFLALQRGGPPYAQLPLRFVSFVVLAIGLSGIRGWKVSFLSLWIVTLVVVSFFPSGYSPDLTWYAMSGAHRALPALPILGVLLAIELQRWWGRRPFNMLVSTAALTIALAPSLETFVTYPYQDKQPLLPYLLAREYRKNVPLDLRSNPAFFYRSDVHLFRGLHRMQPWDKTMQGAQFSGSCVPEPPPPTNSIVMTVVQGPCEKSPTPPGYIELQRFPNREFKGVLMYLYTEHAATAGSASSQDPGTADFRVAPPISNFIDTPQAIN